uniref:THD domain-containing protein n=1 Tax=Corvus moneduloides TaxID=1196302 RepID=A0A8C3E1S1_CORMO
MEAPAMLENGNAPQNRKSTCLQVAFYALIFVLIIISALVSTVFCLLHHKQAPGPCWAHGSLKQSSTQSSEDLNWDWKLEHCNGIVQDQGQYLIIEQSGNYFIYAQLYRQEKIKEPFSLMLYKDPKIALNNAVGHDNGTVNFARPFFLEKGDKLYCKKNDDLDNILLKNQTYWGLFKM